MWGKEEVENLSPQIFLFQQNLFALTGKTDSKTGGCDRLPDAAFLFKGVSGCL
jgi:hypothetical protein